MLCALVGEHLGDLDVVAGEMRRVIRPGGRVVFSVYHPAMSAAGKEARFLRDGVDYRLGAIHHELDDYRAAFGGAMFVELRVTEHEGDEALVRLNPDWERYRGFPILVVITMNLAGDFLGSNLVGRHETMSIGRSLRPLSAQSRLGVLVGQPTP